MLHLRVEAYRAIIDPRSISRNHHILWHDNAAPRVNTCHVHCLFGVQSLFLRLHYLVIINTRFFQTAIITAMMLPMLDRLFYWRELKQVKIINKLTLKTSSSELMV